MMKKQKKFVVVVFMVVFITSALSVSSMVKNVRNNSFDSFAQGSKCTAQGVFMPEPFEETLVAPIDTQEEELFYAQGYEPPKFIKKDDNDNSGS